MATVVSVRTHLMDVPRARPVSSSYATYGSLGVVAVEVETDDGVVGQGWTNVIGGGAASIANFLAGELAPLVEGSDPAHVRDTWQRMFLHSLSRGRKGIAMYALSALDIALWDARAQAAGLPLHHMLGAFRETVPVYGDGCWLSYSIGELEQSAVEYSERGFWGVKVKVGADVDDSLARVSAVRDVLGPGGRVMVDANQCYDVLTARRFALRATDLDLTWFEEPLIADSVHDYAKLTGSVSVPIAAGENEYSRYGFRELIEHSAVDILQPDVHRVGGITEFMRIAALAEAWNIPVAPHTSWELHAQLLACVSTGMAAEYFDWFPADFFASCPEIVNGVAHLSDTPGHGARFAPEVYSRYAA